MEGQNWVSVLLGLSLATSALLWLAVRAKRFFLKEIVKKKVFLGKTEQKAYLLLDNALGASVTSSIVLLIVLWVAWWQTH